MNERIRELAEHAESPNPHTPGYWTFNNSQLEFFAELIVRECAGIYSKIDNGNLHLGTDDYPEALQKHFGVDS